VTVALELGALGQLAASHGSVELAARVEAVRVQLLDATAELRELAHGLHPAVLTQDGLEAAIGFLADCSAVPVQTTVAVGRRLPSEVESTAYFVVSEALTNAAKHAFATVVRVGLEVTDLGLAIAVVDNGVGGATIRAGTGLEGVADRLATSVPVLSSPAERPAPDWTR
jgi:signal transduction histidine kinase